MPSLIDLPNEVLHRIGSVLLKPRWSRTQDHKNDHFLEWPNLKDVGSLRLACRRFDEIGAYYVLQEIKFYLTGADFAMLAAIARRPASSQYVRSLVYIASVLGEHAPLDLEEFQDTVMRQHQYHEKYEFMEEDFRITKSCEALIADFEGTSSGHGLEPREEPCDGDDQEAGTLANLASLIELPFFNEFKGSNGKLKSRRRELTPDILKGYRSYQKLSAWHTETLKHGLDRKFLERVIPVFSNVRHITVVGCDRDIAFGHDWLSGRRGGRFEGGPLKEASWPAFLRDGRFDYNETSIPHAEAMLSALRGSSITLETLRISRVNCLFLREFGADEPDEAVLRVCGGLREFELEIAATALKALTDHYLTFDVNTSLQQVRTCDGEECDKIVATGSFRKMLRAMPNLEKLKLGFDCGATPIYDGHFVSFTQILERGFVWSRLRSITLSRIRCHRDEMLEFISNHKDHLGQDVGNHVLLEDLKICDSSLLVFLPLLRQIAIENRIKIQLRGVAIGEDEKSGRKEKWYICDDEFFDVEYHVLAHAVDEYVQGRSQECPFTRYNMLHPEE